MISGRTSPSRITAVLRGIAKLPENHLDMSGRKGERRSCNPGIAGLMHLSHSLLSERVV
jgi:hypothetical protein